MTNPYKFMDLPPINDCPFCGSGDTFINENDDDCWVACDACESIGPAYKEMMSAITQWNTPTHHIEMLIKDADRLRRELDDCNGVIR